ncbi:hypothetical protein [Mycolicibacterium sarraceniae]|uniref:Uncharacterized protein n=1 Tax=Mycolicibacterium sarraceniae TaxID=1534348 RepID=A0A7I7STU4_9MYCO|nr:hypothetical protein [Mycolicibacterium sarraceniae]BBY60228.1 hypothetical protein MSAR_33640 [Mycolicibacterium sarraceniae]
MSGGVGPFEGMQDEKTGEITVFCDAQSHQLWELVLSRRGDGPWMPDPFESIGEDHIRTTRRGGGIEFIDAAGQVVRFWDSGRGINDRAGMARIIAEVDRARKMAGMDAEAFLPLGRRYQLRCPLCSDTVRRAEPKLREHLNHLWEQDITRISLNGLRELDRLL